MSWFEAEQAAYEAALLVAANETEREEWAGVIYETRTEWMRAYERAPIGSALDKACT